MPDVQGLKNRARALAAIGLILAEVWRYEWAPSDCAGQKGVVLTSDTAERWLQVHLHEDDGAVIFLWDRDAGFPPYEGAERTNTLWKAVLAEIPTPCAPASGTGRRRWTTTTTCRTSLR
ncbi:hypothetical protein ACIQVA_35470 [Streptomyces microflavus]|uniref:hypothetical protein n=1 Tax=Streptomyces microflavus TaxID=1919 RepID=UPI00381D07D7